VAKRGVGISGVALLLTSAGAWLVFVGVRDVPPVGGLRELLRGKLPEGSARRSEFGAVGVSPAQSEGVTAVGSAATGRLVTVNGIRVDSSIGAEVSQLVTKARPNLLTGGGYRSPTQQAALRVAHCCGDPRSSRCGCGPPTAPVGSSMHERGLAVDFSWNGTLIRSRDSAGFRFLSRYAPPLGLHNLPSEPWHWSTNGH
jgi:hypothetical protein